MDRTSVVYVLMPVTPKFAEFYRITYDPWDSFGHNPCFRRQELLDMLENGFLAEGTKIECHGRTIVVVRLRGNYKLKEIG